MSPKLLHESATPRSLDVFRIYVFGIWFLKILIEPTHHLAFLPSRIFEPLGIFRIVPAEFYAFIFDPSLLHALKIGILASLVLFFAGKLRRASAATACALLVFHQGLHRGITFTNHAEMSLLYAAVIPTLFDFADPRRRRSMASPDVNWNALPLQVVMAVICLAYTFIGVHRLIFGGLGVFTSDSLRFWIVQAGLPCDTAALDISRLSLTQPLINHGLNIGFAVTTVFEALTLLCLVSRRFRITWLVVILGFHAAVHFFMKISFWENALLLVLFLDYHPWIAGMKTRTVPSASPGELEIPARAIS